MDRFLAHRWVIFFSFLFFISFCVVRVLETGGSIERELIDENYSGSDSWINKF